MKFELIFSFTISVIIAFVNVVPIAAHDDIGVSMLDNSIAKAFNIGANSLLSNHVPLNKKIMLWGSNSNEVLIFIIIVVFLVLALITAILFCLSTNAKLKRSLGLELADRQAMDLIGREKGSMIKHFGHIMENVSISYIIVVDDIIIQTNSFSERELGIEAGLNMRDFYKNAEIYDKIKRDLETQEYSNGEIALLFRANGDVHRHHISAGLIEYESKKGYLIFSIDIEELERQKDYTKRSQGDMQKIIDVLPISMAIINLNNYELRYANNEFMSLYGFKDIEQARAFDYSEMGERVFACWQGKAIEFEYDGNKHLNRDLYIKMFADQIIFKGANCIVLISQDISGEVKRANMLMRAAEKEREANLLKGVFLANMSHEVRTPMNAIIGLSDLALMKQQTSDNYDMFSKISLSAKNLLSIINDILDFSKIEAERLELVEEKFNLEETITNAFLVTAESIEDKFVEILLDIKPDVPCSLIGDKTRLWQVLKNLLDNSVKYTNSGRIVLSISLADMEERAVTLNFHVKDTGIGMSDEQLEKLFTPFTQFSRNNSKKAGTGLGMVITKQLITLMHGEINVQSKINYGTDIFVTIPFKLPDKYKTIQEYSMDAMGNCANSSGKALVVDDNEYSLSITAQFLKYAGVEAVCASNGRQALNIVEEYAAQGEQFKIILIDYVIGEENGIDVANRINAVVENAKLLLITAYSRRIISESQLREVGFKDIIEKPFVVSSFLQKVCNVISEEKGAEAYEQLSNFAGSRVLLCEDNLINQAVASGLLKSYNVEVSVANNGEEALDILEEQTFDLILMDIVMPVMDGHEATISIRNSGKPYCNIPIVAMTANVMADEVERCMSERMNGHIEKPIDVEKFELELAKFLSKH